MGSYPVSGPLPWDGEMRSPLCIGERLRQIRARKRAKMAGIQKGPAPAWATTVPAACLFPLATAATAPATYAVPLGRAAAVPTRAALSLATAAFLPGRDATLPGRGAPSLARGAASLAGTAAADPREMAPLAGGVAHLARAMASLAGTVASLARERVPLAGMIAALVGTVASLPGTMASPAGMIAPLRRETPGQRTQSRCDIRGMHSATSSLGDHRSAICNRLLPSPLHGGQYTRRRAEMPAAPIVGSGTTWTSTRARRRCRRGP